MKLPLFVSCVLATVLAVAPVFAQPQTQEAKPQEITDGESPFAHPTTQVRDFFRILAEGRVDAAYDQLLKGTLIAGKPEDLAMLKKKTREAIQAFGPINGYEIAGVKNVGRGSHLMCLTCLSLGKQLPIRWRFYFYNADSKISYPASPSDANPVIINGTWKLIDIRIDDRLVDMFEEPAPAVAGSVK